MNAGSCSASGSACQAASSAGEHAARSQLREPHARPHLFEVDTDLSARFSDRHESEVTGVTHAERDVAADDEGFAVGGMPAQRAEPGNLDRAGCKAERSSEHVAGSRPRDPRSHRAGALLGRKRRIERGDDVRGLVEDNLHHSGRGRHHAASVVR